MLKLTFYYTSIFLIGIIFIRMPEDGLNSFATTTTILGSPSSARQILNILTAIGILIYFGVAILFNLRT